VKRWLANFGRHKIVGNIIRWVFVHMSFIIPVQRLYESNSLLAFHHPAPSYPFHVLIVPKKDLPGMQSISSSDAGLLLEVIQVVQAFVKNFGLEKTGYRLVANGGAFQDIPQLHFHLIAEQPPYS